MAAYSLYLTFNTEISLYEPLSNLSFPSLGITEITASFHNGGILKSLRAVLQILRWHDTNSALNARYHSAGKPSGPGVSDPLSLEMALLSSSSFTAVVNILFCISEKTGRFRESSVGILQHNILAIKIN